MKTQRCHTGKYQLLRRILDRKSIKMLRVDTDSQLKQAGESLWLRQEIGCSVQHYDHTIVGFIGET
jgi:hypothetical protein